MGPVAGRGPGGGRRARRDGDEGASGGREGGREGGDEAPAIIAERE
jgi:hypothetical protein